MNIFKSNFLNGQSRTITSAAIILAITSLASRFLGLLRDRLLAGLSLGTLVIEGGQKSGTKITAGFAADYGREVFCVPGPIDSPASAGPAQLIQNGAKLVTKVEDIYEELPAVAIA